ncbi:MAG: hypothetical protein ACKVII_10370, partial [Planctomycetales bacterium]
TQNLHEAIPAATPSFQHAKGTLRLKPELAGGKLMTLFRLGDATLKRTKPLDGFHSGYGFGC